MALGACVRLGFPSARAFSCWRRNKGRIKKIEPRKLLQYSHFSPLAGLPDEPQNYHTVTIELAEAGPKTRVSLAQDNNSTDEARQHSEKNWTMMLEGLKKLLEK